jgi:hypothetical protein
MSGLSESTKQLFRMYNSTSDALKIIVKNIESQLDEIKKQIMDSSMYNFSFTFTDDGGVIENPVLTEFGRRLLTTSFDSKLKILPSTVQYDNIRNLFATISNALPFDTTIAYYTPLKTRLCESNEACWQVYSVSLVSKTGAYDFEIVFKSKRIMNELRYDRPAVHGSETVESSNKIVSDCALKLLQDLIDFYEFYEMREKGVMVRA